MASTLGARRSRRDARRRQGVRGVSRGARTAGGTPAVSRVARLAAGLDEPLLVTDGVNVRYLLGFQSSNCAVLVEPDGTTTLYTDFRYLEAARAIDGVEVVQTRRDVAGALAELLAGRRVGFEASPYLVRPLADDREWRSRARRDPRARRGAPAREGRRRARCASPSLRDLGRRLRSACRRAVRRTHREGHRVVDRENIP